MSTAESGFRSDPSGQTCWKRPTVLWASGHTHYNFDFKDEVTGKRVVANQKGYYIKMTPSKKGANETPFDAGKTISVRAQ